MPMTLPASRPFEGEAGDHAGVRRAGHGAHDHVVEEDVALGFLRGDLAGPVGEAEPAERVVGRPGRDRIRLAAGVQHGVEGPLPAVPHADVEPGFVEADVAAHDARQLDVADAAVVLVGFVDPVLLHGHGAEAEVAGDAGHRTGVVGLDPSDRHQRVAALGERLGGEVLELADLVAAEGDPGVAVLPLGPHLDATTQCRAEARQRVDR